MNSKSFCVAALLGVGWTGSHLISPNLAAAQSTTTGSISGAVSDADTGEKLAGVTVIVSSPSLQGTQDAITDENGQYAISSLPPGTYLVTFYYLNGTVKHPDVAVGVSKNTPVFQKMKTSTEKGEVIINHATVPTIDTTSTNQGITIDKNYMNNIPIPGRTFDATLGAAAGSQNDGLGTSFSGSSSLENQYYVDGVNTTGLTFGTVGTPVINDFIQEIEVITGGYNAEYGRATGGVVNVVTKSGSNEFKGDIFGYYQPGFLTAAAKTTPINASSIDAVGNIAYNADFGFDLGGPIIKDKLWFYVGFGPQFGRTDVTRTTKRERDCQGVNPDGSLTACNPKPASQGGFADGVPDVDPKTGFFITDNIDSEIRSDTTRAYSLLTKINYAANAENQGQLAFQAQPSSSRNPNIFGPAAAGFTTSNLTTDLSGKWTSKFFDNKLEIEATVGWHRDRANSDALDPTDPNFGNNSPQQVLENGSLNTWDKLGYESAATNAACADGGPNDPYPNIVNCPMSSRGYLIGGPGAINRDIEQRKSAKLAFTYRVKAAGTHEIKGGIDGEDNTSSKARLYSGGAAYTNDVGDGQIIATRWVQLTSMSNTDPFFNGECRTPDPVTSGSSAQQAAQFKCAFLSGVPGSRGTQISGESLNWAAYLRDSWQIQPNLTLNYGVRYEEQRLRYASFLRNTLDPLTGNELGTDAMSLTGNWAPRVGLLYDPTKEGRAKIYANWGRFYESIPMDINDREFGGEVTYQQTFSTGANNQCGATNPAIGGPNATGCLSNPNVEANGKEQLIGSSGVLIAPGIKSQYLDEVVAGVEYEVLNDLKIGVSLQDRRLGRIIEDVSTDGANTYIVANPGTFSSSEQAALQERVDLTTDPTDKARLAHQLKLFEGIRIFDPPVRDYDALQFTLTRRFSKALYLQASYTYSKTEGNYPGLISYDNGQVDPNISSQYDLIELLANRYGPLPQDRPHYIKVDGYYTFDFQRRGQLTLGIRFRALSGVPEEALASHYLYGPNESFLLPRGELGRTQFDTGLDLHVGYKIHLHKNYDLELFVDAYNVYDSQTEATTDDTYAPSFKLSAPNSNVGSLQNANPVSGGQYSDLIWVKTIDQNGNETSTPIGRNPNFHNPTSRYAPAYGRVGFRLSF